MDVIQLSDILDVIGAVLSVMGTLAVALGTVYAFFRKRIKAWWGPYRRAVENMGEIPAISKTVDQTRAEVANVNKSVAMLTLTMRARADNNVGAAEFECAVDGSNTYVNITYARWLGVGKNELLDWNWLNFVHPEDVGRVRREWDRCREEHRVYRQRYRLIAANGDVIEVETMCTPIPDAPPAHCWIGIMRRLDNE